MGLTEILGFCILAGIIFVIILMLIKKDKLDAEKLKTDLFKDIREYQAESTNSLKNDILSEIRASRSETVSTIQNTMKIISDTLTTNQRQADL